MGGDQPQVGWCAPPQGPKAPRVWGGGAPTLLGGKFPLSPPLGRHPRWVWGCRTPWGGKPRRGRSPLPLPYIYLRFWGCHTQEFPPLPGAALPLFLLISCGDWRSPAGVPHSSTTTTPSCCCWTESSPTSPSLLAGSRHGRRHRVVRVLNAEVSSVRH